MQEQIVKNGCSGKCCEGFTLPFSKNEFDRMMEAIKIHRALSEDEKSLRLKADWNYRPKYLRDDGTIGSAYENDEIEQIYNMVIYLGKTNHNPNDIGGNHTAISELFKYARCIPEDEQITKEDFLKGYNSEHREWHLLEENGEITMNYYTCKNFDIEKRICKIYDQRPKMCRSFGRGCKYESCGFEAKRKLEEEKLISEILAKETKRLSFIGDEEEDLIIDEETNKQQ